MHAPAASGERDPALQVREPERRVAGGAREPDVVARLRGVAAQRVPGRQRAERRDRDRARTARRVAADELHPLHPGERVHPGGEGLDPRLVHRRQREREQEPARVGAHRGQVGQVDRERLVPEAPRLRARREVRALGERVGGERKDEARRRTHERAVVAHPERGGARRAGEVPRDQLELGQHAGRPRCAAAPPDAAAARAGRARRSRTCTRRCRRTPSRARSPR